MIPLTNRRWHSSGVTKRFCSPSYAIALPVPASYLVLTSRDDRRGIIDRFLFRQIDIACVASLLGATAADLRDLQLKFDRIAHLIYEQVAPDEPYIPRGTSYRYPSYIRDSVIRLARTVYAGLSPAHIRKRLKTEHDVSVGGQTLYNWLIHAQLWTAALAPVALAHTSKSLSVSQSVRLPQLRPSPQPKQPPHGPLAFTPRSKRSAAIMLLRSVRKVAAMDPLPHEPRTLRQFVEADLRRAARLIIKVQDEIDPQFRFSTPEGDYHLAVTLPADDYERRSMLRRVSAFITWKQALGFTLASELIDPDCVYCLGVTAKEVCACLSRVRREPKPWTRENFGPIKWIDRAQIGQEMIDLLPRGPRPMTPKETAMLEKCFGPEGRYPAVHLPTGQLRGI